MKPCQNCTTEALKEDLEGTGLDVVNVVYPKLIMILIVHYL